MTPNDHGSLLDRIATARKAREATIGAARRPPSTSAHRIGAALLPGDRVFDQRTARSATVVTPPPATSSAFPAIAIQFDDGTIVTRGLAELIARPSPPSGL